MARATQEDLQINLDIMSTVGWTGDKLNDFQIEKLKEKLKANLQTLIYDTVLEFEDDWEDSGLYDFTVQMDIKQLNKKRIYFNRR